MPNKNGCRRCAARLGLAAVAMAAMAAGLAGCKTNNVETAWQLIQQQQQEQALARQKEDAAQARRVADAPEMMLSMISETQRQGRYFASLAYIDAFQRQFGSDARVAAMRAEALRQTGQVEQSEQAYRALLGTPQAAQGWHGLGLIAGARGQYAQAADDLARAAQLSPMDPGILGDLGFARLRAGDPAGARVPLGQAAELAPDSAKAQANLAVLLLVEGETGRAQSLMARAQLSGEARLRVLSLAEEIRRQTAAAPSGGPVMAAGDPAPGLPIMSPLMDRLGNGPIVR